MIEINWLNIIIKQMHINSFVICSLLNKFLWRCSREAWKRYHYRSTYGSITWRTWGAPDRTTRISSGLNSRGPYPLAVWNFVRIDCGTVSWSGNRKGNVYRTLRQFTIDYWRRLRKGTPRISISTRKILHLNKSFVKDF